MAPRRVAPFIGALAGTTLVTAALLALGAVGSEPVHADGVVYLLGFLVMALTGCVLVRFLPRHTIGWVFVAGGTGTLLAAALRGLAVADVPGGGAWLGTLALIVYGLSWIAVTTLPLLLFPVLVPVIIGAVKATGETLPGTPPGGPPWLNLLIAFDAIFLALAYLLFEYVIEE